MSAKDTARRHGHNPLSVFYRLSCAQCGCSCLRADLALERTWRHLDAMQFKTELNARTPRSRCSDCGVKTIGIPWAGKNFRFTLIFEAFGVEVLQACSNVKRAAELLDLHWNSMHLLIERAVQRGLERRELDDIEQRNTNRVLYSYSRQEFLITSDCSPNR